MIEMRLLQNIETFAGMLLGTIDELEKFGANEKIINKVQEGLTFVSGVMDALNNHAKESSDEIMKITGSDESILMALINSLEDDGDVSQEDIDKVHEITSKSIDFLIQKVEELEPEIIKICKAVRKFSTIMSYALVSLGIRIKNDCDEAKEQKSNLDKLKEVLDVLDSKEE